MAELESELNLDHLLEGLRSRRRDEGGTVRLRRETLAKALPDSPSKAYLYLVESMEPVDTTYTQKTFDEAERVRAQLERGLRGHGLEVEFEYQGSVTNDTHIRLYSDIDLLVLDGRFHFVRQPLVPTRPFESDPIDCLDEVRSACVLTLTGAFPAATVDDSGSKAVAIRGGSLRRKIDVVSASWLNTAAYVQTRDVAERGVRVLDRDAQKTVENFPFKHNRRIEEKDIATGGKARRLIRLLKSIRSDTGRSVDVSSYDIAALVYNLPQAVFDSDDDLAVTIEACRSILGICRSEETMTGLLVPNQTRRLFCDGGLVLSSLLKLLEAVTHLCGLALKRRR